MCSFYPINFCRFGLEGLKLRLGDSSRISRRRLPETNFFLHTSSFFKGCKGNDNRFSSVESCVNTCGGNEPETDAKCKDVTCDESMATFMKAKGCVPKIKPRSQSFTSLMADLSQDIS